MQSTFDNIHAKQPVFTQDKLEAKKRAERLASADGTNPEAQLDKDSFMKLLLTELQYQDPTAPMDSAKMLQQTSQLATLETQESTNKLMKQLAGQISASSHMNVIGTLGKMAVLNSDISIDKDHKTANLSITFEHDVKSGTITILDNKNNIVDTLKIADIHKGFHPFTWEGVNQDGNAVPNGDYSVKIEYQDPSGVTYRPDYSKGHVVEGVKFDKDGKALLKINGNFTPLDKIKEFYENQQNSQESPQS